MKKNKGGRPTKYTDKINELANMYIDKIIQDKDIPYVEELAEELNVHRETILIWSTAKNKENKLLHPEFSDTIKRIEDRQRFMLQKGSTTGKYNPAAAIFQLKANHGMIETEKRILAGDKDEPIQIEFVDEIKRV